MVKKYRVKLDKRDQLRALLTDTFPSDIPIIFSNDGLYGQAKRFENTNLLDSVFNVLFSYTVNIESTNVEKKQHDSTLPYKFKILKRGLELRTLSLIHPRSQYNECNFYAQFAPLITSFCERSNFSIRAPHKVGSSMFVSNKSLTNKYKEVTVEITEEDLEHKYASSFFTYKGYDRLYKFFNSDSFYMLEKQFKTMCFLDISNCFNSIYTHTIAWAVKTKEFAKANRSSNQFGNNFDEIIQRSNDDETNGIPIGAEFSRIFAEVIFQDIDVIIETQLQKKKLRYGIDYSIKRYVDDFTIFANDDNDLQTIKAVISDSIAKYNLSIQHQKTETYPRPFMTVKSDAITKSNSILNDLFNTLFRYEKDDEEKTRHTLIRPQKIRHKFKFIRSYINKIKTVCYQNDSGYALVASYIISVLSNKIIELKEAYLKEKEENKEEYSIRYRDAFELIIEMIFFFHSVCPSVKSSEKLSKTVIIADRFFKENIPEQQPYIQSHIIQNVQQLTFDHTLNEKRDGFISLERLNVILSTTEFGENYLIPKKFFTEYIEDVDDIPYFHIISFLYYFRKFNEYKDLVSTIESHIQRKLNNINQIVNDSELCHLFLDSLSCPYLSSVFRQSLLKQFYTEFRPPGTWNRTTRAEYCEKLLKSYWFVNWQGLDLLKLLERKELNAVY